MATEIRNEGNTAVVGIIIAVLVLGLLVAYLLGVFPGATTAPSGSAGSGKDTTVIERNRTDVVPAPSQPSTGSSSSDSGSGSSSSTTTTTTESR